VREATSVDGSDDARDLVGRIVSVIGLATTRIRAFRITRRSCKLTISPALFCRSPGRRLPTCSWRCVGRQPSTGRSSITPAPTLKL